MRLRDRQTQSLSDKQKHNGPTMKGVNPKHMAAWWSGKLTGIPRAQESLLHGIMGSE